MTTNIKLFINLLSPDKTPWKIVNNIYDILTEIRIKVKINRKRLFEKHNAFRVKGVKKSIKKFNELVTLDILEKELLNIINIINKYFELNEINKQSDLSRNFRQSVILIIGNIITGQSIICPDISKFWTYDIEKN
jgi:hypothetical protein